MKAGIIDRALIVDIVSDFARVFCPTLLILPYTQV